MGRTLRRFLLVAAAAVLVIELAVLRLQHHPGPPVPHAHAVVVSEDKMCETFALRVRRMLAAGNVDALESLADSLRAHRTELPSGIWYCAVMFSDGFGGVDPPGDARHHADPDAEPGFWPRRPPIAHDRPA